jgi:hypothetical protein
MRSAVFALLLLVLVTLAVRVSAISMDDGQLHARDAAVHKSDDPDDPDCEEAEVYETDEEYARKVANGEADADEWDSGLEGSDD